MIIRSIELTNFRKFRGTRRIEGFENGLNVVVEPNETGKSTLLEALRAAVFVRHSANTELTRSYCPFGDQVAPRVAMEFELDDGLWQLEKRFLRSSSAMLTGPMVRLENDAAEERLQELFGFDRGNNRGSDPEVRGALGLLWVEQATALAVDAPGTRVCETVRAALEAEVGAMVGGRDFEAVMSSVERALSELRTLRSGKSTGRLQTAELRVRQAVEDRAEAERQAQAYEGALSELEQARNQRRIIVRDLADPEQEALREELERRIQAAEGAAASLETARARHDEQRRIVDGLEGEIRRIEDAIKAEKEAQDALADLLAGERQAEDDHAAVVKRERSERQALAEARKVRDEATAQFARARTAIQARDRAAAIAAARARMAVLEAIDAEREDAEEVVALAVGTETLRELLQLERAAVTAHAVADASAVRIELEVHDKTEVVLGGERVDSGAFTLEGPTAVEIGPHASILVVPPSVGGDAARATHRTTEANLFAALARAGVANVAEAQRREEAAMRAREKLSALQRQADMLCIADPLLELEAGEPNLRRFLAGLRVTPDDLEMDAMPNADLTSLEAALTALLDAEREAGGRHDAASRALHNSEASVGRVRQSLAVARRDLEVATALVGRLNAERGLDELSADFAREREELARRAVTLVEAEHVAATYDVPALRARLNNQQRSRERAQAERDELVGRIASLQTTVEIEGARGLPGALAAALEEEEEASAELRRLTDEADALTLLREVLTRAAGETSRRFLAPVSRRAVRYVSRIFPGCELEFDEKLGLTTVTRDGRSEASGALSRGTQEQLAVLTRLAFADLLQEQGAPVSLILDDPLAYSDDARLDTIGSMLEEASRRMQVILLTCRARPFRHLEAHRIGLS